MIRRERERDGNRSKRPIHLQNHFQREHSTIIPDFKDLQSVILKLIKEIEAEGALPNAFFEASITLTIKQG